MVALSVGAAGVVEGLQGAAVGEPETAVGAEDDEGEGVAEEEFQDGADYHEEAAAEEICRSVIWS